MSTKFFFITGLPRSRSAWLANFFTTQGSHCWHDAMKDGWTAEYVRSKVEGIGPECQYAGDADSGLLLVAAKLAGMFPQARWLFVKNTPQRAAESYRKWFGRDHPYPGVPADTDMDAIMRLAEIRYEAALLAVPAENRMEIPMDDLDDPFIMRAVWEWLVPGLTWDERRYRMLDTFCVNVIPSKVTVKMP